MKAVVILGAGASADFGVPTLSGIFQDPFVLNYLRRDRFLLSHLQNIFWQPRGYDLKTAGESLTVEEMLTILRDWEQEDGAPKKLSPEEVSQFKKSLYTLIQHAVHEGKNSRPGCLNQLIHYLHENTTLTTWASFNWDCIFEASYWYQNSARADKIRYGRNPKLVIQIDNWMRVSNRDELLKLHGSIGWWMIDNRLTYLPFSADGPLVKKWQQYARDSAESDYPVILEPSAYKYRDEVYKILEPQWSHFMLRLLEADFVLIIGYSLPDLDSQARSKILIGFQANEHAKWLVVDPSDAAIAKYQRLLGRDNRVTLYKSGLSAFNNDLASNIEYGLSDSPF